MFMRKLAISDHSPLMHKMCLEKPATMFYSMFLYYFFILIEFSIGILHEWRIFLFLYHGALLKVVYLANRVSALSGLCSQEEERLVRDLFRGYNKLIRPVQNMTEKVDVAFGLAFIQLINVVSIV